MMSKRMFILFLLSAHSGGARSSWQHQVVAPSFTMTLSLKSRVARCTICGQRSRSLDYARGFDPRDQMSRLKPQGVCRDEMCFPLPNARRSEFLTKRGKTEWFNLSEFARLLRQPVARDAE